MESQHRWLWLSKNLKWASFTGSCCVRRLLHLTICWLTRLKKSVARMLMRRLHGLQVTSRCEQVFTGQPDRNNSCMRFFVGAQNIDLRPHAGRCNNNS